MKFGISAFLFASCPDFSLAVAVQGLGSSDLARIDKKILRTVRQNTATIVRLAFHDCVGGCNGCLNVNNPDNAGLQGVVEALEELYVENGFDALLSRADYWAYAGQLALRQVVSVTDGVEESDLDISFQTGRVDCDTAPYTDDDVELPSATLTYEELTAFYSERFGMNEEQAVAIMGAHTLGHTSPENSGYKGSWVSGEGNLFNNNYYTLMLSEDWIQRNVNNDTEPRWQWNAATSRTGMMLNADLCLLKALELDEFGESACTVDTCGKSGGATYVQKFADSQSTWLEKFSKAWTIMQSAGDYTLVDLED